MVQSDELARVPRQENPLVSVMPQAMEHGGQGECKKLGKEVEIDGDFQENPFI